MAGFKSSMVVLFAFMAASIQLQSSIAQTRHVVGDSVGWIIPSGGAAAYISWAAGRTFTIGDVLVFNFTNGQHTVAEVSQAAYDPCTSTNPMSLTTTGPASLTLSTAGTHYYICTVGTHCQIGQKLTINVSAATNTPAPAPATPRPAPPTPTPASPPSPTPVPVPVPVPVPAPAPSTTTSPPPSPTPTPSPTESSPPAPPPASRAPGSSATPAPGSSATPSPSSSTNPPPPPAGSAPSSVAVVPVTFLAIALAFFH